MRHANRYAACEIFLRPIMQNNVMGLVFFFIMMAAGTYVQSMPEFPTGWQPATKADYADGNLSFMKNQAPNHIIADFNGDGKIDDAWILINTSKNAFGLFVFLAQKDGTHKMIPLDEHRRETEKLFMGISLMEPGQYKTACGKGYWKCEEDEPEVLKLKFPGINYFAFESANSVFFWNSSKKEFTRIWMSD